jgi:hypothetical protein
MTKRTILIFGESTNGELYKLLYLSSLQDISRALGEPSATGLGVPIAIQAMLSNHLVLFYTLKEEGVNFDHYQLGFKKLEKDLPLLPIEAIAIPGVSSRDILELATPFCNKHKSIILFSEKDLYDLKTGS